MNFEEETRAMVDRWYGHPLSNHLANNVGRGVFMRDIPTLLERAHQAGREQGAREERATQELARINQELKID